MAARRLAKDKGSLTSGGCPALYDNDDPDVMWAQGKKLSKAEMGRLLELLDDETAVAIPTETILRGMAKYATQHGDDELAARIEAFLTAKGM
jgi:hypothetical protein